MTTFLQVRVLSTTNFFVSKTLSSISPTFIDTSFPHYHFIFLVYFAVSSPETIDCFIHAVSPVKKAAASKKTFFNCILQTETDVMRAVCFDSDKRAEIDTISKTKSPVKLKHLTTKESSSGTSQDIQITKHTTVTPIDKDLLHFTFSDELSTISQNSVINLSSILKLAPEQLITVKAQVTNISAVKVFNSNRGKLQKQDVIIRDTTASIKVVLWQEYVDILQTDETYKLENLRVKGFKDDRYLNTPKSDPFTATPCPPFDQPLVEVDDLQEVTSNITQSQVIGFRNATKTMDCISCFKRVCAKPNSTLAVCEKCKLTQPIRTCPTHWQLRVLIRDLQNDKNIALTIQHQQTKDLLLMISPTFNLSTATEDDIQTVILDSNKELNITYDNTNSIITDIKIV